MQAINKVIYSDKESLYLVLPLEDNGKVGNQFYDHVHYVYVRFFWLR